MLNQILKFNKANQKSKYKKKLQQIYDTSVDLVCKYDSDI